MAVDIRNSVMGGGRPHLSSLCRIAVIALAAVILLALPACKYSDVLTQHTEDPDLGALDENAEPIYKSNSEAEERPDLDDISVSTSDDQNEQVAVLPHYDPNAGDNGPTLQRVHSSETPHDEQASEGNEDGEADRTGTGEAESDEGGTDSSNSEGDGEGDQEGVQDPLEDEQSDEQDISTDAGIAGETAVVNPDGVEDETEKGNVAAVGEYATIAQMLGGAGAVTACDQSWLDARAADGVFDGELEKVTAAFSGDGSEAGSLNLDALKQAAPSVLLWDSAANVPALSDSEKSDIEAAGISVQPVPHIGEQGTEDNEVTLAIAAVASVLDGATGLGYNPADQLSLYNKLHDEALKACYDVNKGYSYKVCGEDTFIQLYQETPLAGLDNSTTNRAITVYVDDIMTPSTTESTVHQSGTLEAGTIKLSNDGVKLDLSDGIGLSVKTSSSDYMLIDYYLQLAGVMNNAYDSAMPEALGHPYMLIPGTIDGFGQSGNYALRSSNSAFFFSTGDSRVEGNWHALGDDDFNVVLTGNQDIANSLIASANNPNGLYNMEKSYRVIVVPTGIGGQWAQGHFDSFLLAPWALRIQSEDNLSAAESYVSAFYQDYLRCKDWTKAVANWDNSQTTG